MRKMKTLHFSLLFIFGCILVMMVHSAYAQYPGCNGHGAISPQITKSGNNVSVIWLYEKPCGGGYANVVTSLDGGITFGNKIDLSKNNTMPFSFGSQVVSDNGIYYAWMNDTFPYTHSIFLTKVTDNGLAFDTPVLVASHDTSPNEIVELDKTLVSGNNVFVIWSTNREIGNWYTGTIFLSKSTDGGLSFDNSIEINNHDTNWYDLETATSDNMTYFLWQSVVNGTCILGQCDSQVHIRSMDVNGNLGKISSPLTLDKASQIKIAASGNDVYLTGVLFRPNPVNTGTGMQIYEQHPFPQWIFFSKSIDGGATFGNILNLSGSRFYCIPSGTSYSCNLGDVYTHASGTGIYISWSASNYTNNSLDAFFVGSMNNGNTFGKVTQLHPYGFNNVVCEFSEHCVSILAPKTSNDTVYLAWSANTAYSNSQHVIFAKSTDGGNTFDYTDISNSTGITASPNMIMGPNNVIYISGIRTGFPEGDHAFFAKSENGGNSFSSGVDLDLQPQLSVPEFPFTIVILMISFVSMIVFYRIKFRK